MPLQALRTVSYTHLDVYKRQELGYDAGFGAGKYADDVASFAVTEMVKRGMK